MSDTVNHPAMTVLQSFFAEMHQWEVKTFQEEKANPGLSF